MGKGYNLLPHPKIHRVLNAITVAIVITLQSLKLQRIKNTNAIDESKVKIEPGSPIGVQSL